jgi:hypothetical protein
VLVVVPPLVRAAASTKKRRGQQRRAPVGQRQRAAHVHERAPRRVGRRRHKQLQRHPVPVPETTPSGQAWRPKWCTRRPPWTPACVGAARCELGSGLSVAAAPARGLAGARHAPHARSRAVDAAQRGAGALVAGVVVRVQLQGERCRSPRDAARSLTAAPPGPGSAAPHPPATPPCPRPRRRRRCPATRSATARSAPRRSRTRRRRSKTVLNSTSPVRCVSAAGVSCTRVARRCPARRPPPPRRLGEA